MSLRNDGELVGEVSGVSLDHAFPEAILLEGPRGCPCWVWVPNYTYIGVPNSGNSDFFGSDVFLQP